MEKSIWHNPQSHRHSTLAITEDGFFLGNPSSSELAQARVASDQNLSLMEFMGDKVIFVPKKNVFRIHGDPRSQSITLSYRNEGVQLGSYTFSTLEEREEAVGVIGKRLNLRLSRQKKSAGWAEALKPGLYFVAILMITIGLAGALGDGAALEATGRTATKARGLITLAEYLGPTGVWVIGGILSAIFFGLTVMKLQPGGESIILEP